MLVDDIQKVNEFVLGLLLKQYSIFHANLISRAIIQNDNMPTDVFEQGIIEIQEAEASDNYEFVPKGWEGV